MNARCYELEMADRLEAVSILDSRGRLREVPVERGAWTYKSSPFQPGREEGGATILGAAFNLERSDPATIRATMLARRADREAKGHFRLPSAGSMFKNDRSLGRPTGAILDELGFKGRRIGDAMVSPWHANIFVNAGRATARDMLALIDLAREEAYKRLGVAIEPEVLFVGEG
jgi:UDP-N-acetylmuramate dehydrogenase